MRAALTLVLVGLSLIWPPALTLTILTLTLV